MKRYDIKHPLISIPKKSDNMSLLLIPHCTSEIIQMIHCVRHLARLHFTSSWISCGPSSDNVAGDIRYVGLIDYCLYRRLWATNRMQTFYIYI